MFNIEENLKALPDKPGVYLHKDKYGEVIYVGKASSLRKRVRQYFRSQSRFDPKVAALVSHIAEFETIVTQTEMEALILENTLIKKYMPRYNVMLRDDKTYPYIKITLGEEWPRIEKTRVLKNDGSKYFGPYADVGAVNRIIELLRDIYRLKHCRATKFSASARPCVYGHIGKCRCMCAEEVNHDAYMADVENVISFLKGRNKETVELLKLRMKKAADATDFEKAAYWRDMLAAANSVIAKQRVDLLSSGNMDIVLAAKPEDGVNSAADKPSITAQVTVFFVRDGRLSGREIHHLDAPPISTKEEIVSAFMLQYYIDQTVIPKEILLESHIPDEDLLMEMLSRSTGRVIKIEVPARGEKRALLKLALNDVSETTKLMAELAARGREKEKRLEDELAEALGLTEPERGAGPPRIEAYDISNTGGADSVGAMVVFEGGRALKSAYRRFRIKSDVRGDDYAAIQEVLYRRLRRAQDESKGFDILPDIMLIDGGKGHVAAALEVTRAMNINVRVAGMVKDDRHRTRGIISENGTETDLKDKPELFHLIGGIQEEVHRFVIDYHRGMRRAKTVRSLLDDIPGIGEKRRNALLTAFGSIDAIREADETALAEIPGMNIAAAKAVHDFFAAKK
jgi:excinuclease ABC subunit C